MFVVVYSRYARGGVRVLFCVVLVMVCEWCDPGSVLVLCAWCCARVVVHVLWSWFCTRDTVLVVVYLCRCGVVLVVL